MTKTRTAHIQRKHAERELYTARQTLGHLVDMYNSGQWGRLYKEDVFAATVRKAREAVDHWTVVLSRMGSSAARTVQNRPFLISTPATRGRNRPAPHGEDAETDESVN
jgi:hypothetical protein